MKRLLLICLLMLPSAFLWAQTSDILYLKNGNVVQGVITESQSDASISILTEKGELLTYPKLEVREVKRGAELVVPERPVNKYIQYNQRDKGYFIATELGVSASLEYGSGISVPIQFAVVNGYRLNQFLEVGIGVGVRCYVPNSDLRKPSNPWAFPLYLDLRGNFISNQSRNCVPYWSFDGGYTFGDKGAFFSPTVGLRIGSNRNNVMVGISYTGQMVEKIGTKGNRMLDFAGIKVGYEF